MATGTLPISVMQEGFRQMQLTLLLGESLADRYMKAEKTGTSLRVSPAEYACLLTLANAESAGASAQGQPRVCVLLHREPLPLPSLSGTDGSAAEGVSPQQEEDETARLARAPVVWGWSLTQDTDDGRLQGPVLTREQAIEGGQGYYEGEPAFYIHRCTRPDPARFLPDTKAIFGLIEDRMEERCLYGDTDWPPLVSALPIGAAKELEELLAAWARKYIPCDFRLPGETPEKILLKPEPTRAVFQRVSVDASGGPQEVAPSGDKKKEGE